MGGFIESSFDMASCLVGKSRFPKQVVMTMCHLDERTCHCANELSLLRNEPSC